MQLANPLTAFAQCGHPNIETFMSPFVLAARITRPTDCKKEMANKFEYTQVLQLG